jgi:tetratricopeptide (TPR) repeat protein
MVFSRFFKKDPATLLEKGQRLLQRDDFAHAALEFKAALELLGDQSESPLQDKCRQGMQTALNALAEVNLSEARHLLQLGNRAKALEHLELAISQASDEGLRARVEELRAGSLPEAAVASAAPAEGHSCSGCGTHDHGHDEEMPDEEGFTGDRFELLVSALQGDLPQRYRAMGEEFAQAYLLADQGRYDEALPILGRVPGAFDNDIVLYEMAVIYHHQGKVDESESLFRRVLSLNPLNPSGNLALFHLLADKGRLQEAVNHLQQMIHRGVLVEQARFMLGDLLLATGHEEEGMKLLGGLLSTPFAKESAKLMVPVLQRQGRAQEAKQLAKQYLKGCC